jgi:hypothetical protein
MNRGQKFVSISFFVLLFICFGVISCFAVTIGTPFPTIASALEYDSSQTAFFYPSSLQDSYDASQNFSACTAFRLFGSPLREEVSFLDFFSGQSGNQKGVGGKGWRGNDPTWKNWIKRIKQGGDVETPTIPSKQEALDLLKEAGAKVLRIEEHLPGGNSPHTYP